MSTILEALRERERGDAAKPAERRERRPVRWRSLVATALGVVAAVLLAMRWSPDPPDARQVAVSAEVPRPPPVQPAAQATPGDALPAWDEAPRAHVSRWQAASPSPAATPILVEAETADAPPAQPSTSGRTTAPGQPGLRLESIAYADAAGERTVKLAIAGAPPVVLRQGESASGIEVQLILPDAVYVRNGPDVFALGAVR